MTNAIAQLLQPSCVLLDCEFKTSDEVIIAIGGKLFKAGLVKESFIQAAIARESRLPTGLPLAGGINAAIPHTEIEHVLKPGLGMATLRKEIGFRNMVSPQEIVPVRLVFLIALDQPKAQIEMLQDVAGVLQNPELVNRLMILRNFKDVINAFEGV
ncbi:MAG TPA: PTS sugar transporter subunit IIA [Pelolinea sp.]|nr:PTS sugar transporter subunit IIA [Pelolinea sp.]